MSIYEERFKPLFLSSGMTDKDLEAAIGLPRGIIYKWEKDVNKSFAKYCGAVAKYFNVSADYLLGTSDIKKPTPVSESGPTDDELVKMWQSLSPEEIQRVKDFALGMIASRKKPPAPPD